jgi:uncharacterized membrane protein YgcG
MAEDGPLGDEWGMRNSIRAMLTTALVAVCGLGVLPARAATPEVRDEGGVFSATAIEKANQVIRTIHRDLRKELLVETFASVPKDRVNDYTRNREEFFAGFVRDRAQAEGLEGIYVMVMKEPPPHRFRIQVGVGQATRQRAFRPADRDQLVRVFQSSFREDHYDEALLQGVAFVQSTLRKNLQGGAVPAGPARSTVPIAQSFRSQPSSGGGVPSFLILGLVVVGGLILSVLCCDSSAVPWAGVVVDWLDPVGWVDPAVEDSFRVFWAGSVAPWPEAGCTIIWPAGTRRPGNRR